MLHPIEELYLIRVRELHESIAALPLLEEANCLEELDLLIVELQELSRVNERLRGNLVALRAMFSSIHN